MSAASLPVGDGFFLSPTNPLATTDQRDLDALAIAIFQTPEIRKAREKALARWRAVIGDDVPKEAWTRCDRLLGDEWTFQCVMKAVNSDPNYPKVFGQLYTPAHEWFGLQVPGGRVSDNPDNAYAIIPIDGYARYELRGQRFDVGDAPFQLVADTQFTATLGLLPWEDVQFAEDGSFTLTLGPEAANGRPNHIQTTVDARYLFLRDSRSDWRQRPNAYRVQRLDKPTAPPLNFEQLRDRAALIVLGDVLPNFWWMRNLGRRPYNLCSPARPTSEIGGLATQRIMLARLKLQEDEAFVVTIRHGGARYRSLLLKDAFSRTLDYWNHLCCLNNAQSVPDDAETTTFAVSIQDPGLYNWIDSCGLREPFLQHRWQGLPEETTLPDEGWAEGRVVKLTELDRYVPATARRVTPAERAAQLAERLESFNLKFIDR